MKELETRLFEKTRELGSEISEGPPRTLGFRETVGKAYSKKRSFNKHQQTLRIQVQVGTRAVKAKVRRAGPSLRTWEL